MRHILLLLLVFTLIINGCGFDCLSYLQNQIKPTSIEGVVIDKQKAETGCFGIIILKHLDQTDTIKNICYCVPELQGLWKYAESGDSLYKPPKSLRVEVYRKGTVKKFDFPCCNL